MCFSTLEDQRISCHPLGMKSEDDLNVFSYLVLFSLYGFYVHFPEGWFLPSAHTHTHTRRRRLQSSYNKYWEIGKVAAIDRRWPGNKSNQSGRKMAGEQWATTRNPPSRWNSVTLSIKEEIPFEAPGRGAKCSPQLHTYMYLTEGHFSCDSTFFLTQQNRINWWWELLHWK